MVPIENVLRFALAQRGDRYVFGAEPSEADPDPDEWDCSELTSQSCDRAGVTPKLPDGAFNQWKHCTRVSMEQGINTRGALLFVGDGTGTGRAAITHVAFSLGDGTTIEARGSRWGVGSWPSPHRFDFAGLIPGVDYSPRHEPAPATPQPQENDMVYVVHAGAVYLLHNGLMVYIGNPKDIAPGIPQMPADDGDFARLSKAFPVVK